jgi:hypothetical protein
MPVFVILAQLVKFALDTESLQNLINLVRRVIIVVRLLIQVSLLMTPIRIALEILASAQKELTVMQSQTLS